MPFEIAEDRLGQLFPAFLAVDAELRLRGIGPAIRRRCQLIGIGDRLDQHFVRMGYPAGPELALAAERGDPVQLRSIVSKVELGGSAIAQDDGYLLALNIIPAAFSISDGDFQMSDFGPGDPTVQGLLLVGLQKAMLQEARTIATDLARERQRSIELLERVSRAAGYLGHDFNNLLSIIRLNGDRLLATELGEQQRRLVGIVRETSERACEITRSLMTLSHQKHDSRSSMVLDRLIDENQAFFSTIAGAAISVQCRLNAPSARVEVPRTGMLNCLMNLIINARDAMPDHGEITISTEVRTAQLAGLPVDGTAGPKAYVAIEVADTGAGMAEDVLKRAFEPFFSTKERGSGVGLASVMEFAQEMGGAACLESLPGSGTAVYIYLPVKALVGETATSSIPVATPGSFGQGSRVMVVEDEPYALEALTEMLEGDGYRVTPATCATEAMAILEQSQHEVLLTDVVMPDISGLELAEWASRKVPDISIVMMSGFVPDNEEIRADWRFIRKPLDIALLREMLHVALQERRKAGLS